MSNTISIETAYNVEFEYSIANVWDRVLAFLIDWLIKIGYLSIVFMLIGTVLYEVIWIGILFILPWVFYSLMFEIFNQGQTPGKKAMQLRVVSLNGRNLETSQLVNRWLLRFLDFLIFSTGVAFLSAISTRKGQRLGDLAANTTVISLKEKEHISNVSKVKLPEGFIGKFPQCAQLKDEEIEFIKEVIRDKSDSSSKVQLALAEKLEDVLGIPKETKSKDYLKQIVYEYNYFQQLEEGLISPPPISSTPNTEEE